MAPEKTKAKHKGLYKRGNVWWIRYAGLDGKVKQKSSRSISFRVAQALLIKYKQEVLEGKEPIPVKPIKNHTLNQLAEQYLTWAERQRSFRSKKGFVKALLKEFGNLPLRQFSIMMLEEWQSKRLAYNKPATVNRHIGTLKHMFTKAVDWEMVEDDTLKKMRRVKLLPENNRRLRYLSMEELQSLIDACPPHLRPIVTCAVNTGMRKEEILSLEWDKHIDLRHGFILLNVTKNGERREVPINQPLKETLQGLVRRIDSPYVFIDVNGNRYKDIKKSFHSALRKASIKDFRFHDLRHCFASHLIMAGIDLTTVKELLGHKDIRMTMRYAHLAPSHKQKAVEVLGEALHNNSTVQLLYNLGDSQ